MGARGRTRPGAIARASIRAIERYRSTPEWHRHGGQCRFTPSCSAYALQAFEQRNVVAELAMVAGRIVRCNPLVRAGTRDEVRRARRHLRPNALRTLFVAMLLGGVLMATAGLAFGQGITGGCNGTINGQPPSELKSGSPLVVGKGEVVEIAGRAPGGSGGGGATQVNYTIEVIEGVFGRDGKADVFSEGKQWRGTVNVDNYLKYGSGLYHVDGYVTDGSYRCDVSFYVRLDGNKVIAYGGLAVGALGGLGTLRSARRKPEMAEFKPSGSEPMSQDPSTSPSAEDIKGDFGKDVDNILGIKPKPDRAATAVADGGITMVGCLGGVAADLFYDAILGALPFTSLAAGEGAGRRIWVKGHPVRGFFMGLIMGLGTTVAIQQFGYWALDIKTAIVFPLTTAVLGAIRGWRGVAYRV